LQTLSVPLAATLPTFICSIYHSTQRCHTAGLRRTVDVDGG
jgi:hypothetical protein